MSGLVLKLSPHERFLINGAVIENGERRSSICICTPRTNILRLKHALHPREATTPASRLCYIAQLALSGDADPMVVRSDLLAAISEAEQSFFDVDASALLQLAYRDSLQSNFYNALKHLRALYQLEIELGQETPR